MKKTINKIINPILRTVKVPIWCFVVPVLIILVFCLAPDKITSFFKGHMPFLYEEPLKMKPVIKYVDRYGKVRSEIKTNSIPKEDFDRITDSFKKVLKGRVEINAITKYVTVMDTILVPQVINTDTTDGSLYVKYVDNYMKLEFAGNYIEETGDFRLFGIDTITYIDYTKKKLFKSNERIINLSNKSPYWHISEGSNITLKEKKDLIVFTLGGYYNPITNKVGIGVGAGVKVFSIKTR